MGPGGGLAYLHQLLTHSLGQSSLFCVSVAATPLPLPMPLPLSLLRCCRPTPHLPACPSVAGPQ